jgi:hypothetical protein
MNPKFVNHLWITLILAAAACQPLASGPANPASPSPAASLEGGWIPVETLTAEPTQPPAPAAGGNKFTDASGGYDLAAPFGWALVALDPQSVSRAIAETPSLAETLEHLRETGMGLERAYIYSQDPSQTREGHVAHVLVYFLQSNLVAFAPMSEMVRVGGEQLHKLDPDMTITSSSITTTASGTDIGVLEASEPYRTPSGVALQLYEKIVIFKTSSGAAILILRIHPDLQAGVVPLFDRMIEDVRLF